MVNVGTSVVCVASFVILINMSVNAGQCGVEGGYLNVVTMAQRMARLIVTLGILVLVIWRRLGGAADEMKRQATMGKPIWAAMPTDNRDGKRIRKYRRI